MPERKRSRVRARATHRGRSRRANKLRVATITRSDMEITQLHDYYGNFEVWKAKGKQRTAKEEKQGISVGKVVKETEE